ncbi:MAG: protein translocase subunit SecDF, partial [Bacteroidetes bacterium]|nr:protein translocase subunit SecDF [Bacteroidota bacterium]
LAVVCIFQLSFTFIANTWDKKAEKFANGDLVKKRHYIDSVGRKPILNLFVRKYNYQDVKERSLNMGLDLRGGMHVTLEVAMNELLQQLSGANPDATFNKAINIAKKKQATSTRGYIDLFYDEIKAINPNVRLSQYFATLDNKESITFSSSNEDVLSFLRKESKSAIDRTYKIIQTRIDKFGVSQPNISFDPNAGRITVELPGADDPERVRKYLQGSAKLEFYETYTLGELGSFLTEADKEYYTLLHLNDKNADSSKYSKADTTKKETVAKTETKTTKDTAKGKTDTVAKKDDKKGKEKEKPKEQPLLALLLSAAGQVNEGMYNSPVVGYVKIADTSKVNSVLAKEEIRSILPTEVKFMWSTKPTDKAIEEITLIALRKTGLTGQEAVITGEVITDAKKDIDRQTNSYEVSMQMNTKGAQEWAKVTTENQGKFVAIVLDDVVYSAPRVINPITGGRSQITGNFTAEEAGDLANILKAGKLPVRVQIIEEAIVGPSLGQDAINSGLRSLLVGFICIIVFMILYYNRSGWVANLALLVNLFFIIGVLASLGAALTLPGMAGIVLTLAMAVDANVLIYERIRDEMEDGKSLKLAIAEGFKAAMSSIIDANLVTLLIGIILLAFGQGPIYGFAVVLVIGILTTLFCSILITRLIFDWLLEKDSKINFGNPVTLHFLRNINYDFVGKRKIFYIISGITIAIGIGSLFVNGLNFGVDFKGGRSYVVEFKKPVNDKIVDIRSGLTTAFGSAPEVKTYGSDYKLDIITDYKVTENGDSVNSQVKAVMLKGMEKLGAGYEPKILREEVVGSTIATEVKNSAFGSIFFSLLVIFIYMIVRFRRWQFALGATVALAHDIFFVLTFFSLFKDVMPFSMNVDQSIIAALLTIACYSMNDTVVVFDRIREYLNNNKKAAMIPTINTAINKTLSRTVITSFTVFMIVLILFIFGGQVIKGFSFAMLVGIIVGTYSSIFVATPIVVDFHKKKELDAESFN